MNLATTISMVRHFGLGWTGYRAWHSLVQRTGHYRRKLPMQSWEEISLEKLLSDSRLADPERLQEHRANAPSNFIFDIGDRSQWASRFKDYDHDCPSWPDSRLGEIEQGLLRFFSQEPLSVGFPPAWNDNLFEDKPGPARIHFSEINEFGYGDVKCIWEPSRFSFVYDLLRIAWRTEDPRCAELFWRSVESWYASNPPNTGINWKCGQEASFRAMAWCFGLFGFSKHKATTPARLALMVQLLGVTARRIEAHLGYGLSQNNNHGISEAMGLFTLGLLFPELQGSQRWVLLGKKHLESQAEKLIYDDGGFSQYSANYHRVMLHDSLYAIRVGVQNGEPLSAAFVQRVQRAGLFLYEMMDDHTGHLPRYGSDDGALVLPLSNSDYGDFRPVVQSVACVTSGARVLPTGPWDEESLWLGGQQPLEQCKALEKSPLVVGRESGCHVLRSSTGFVMARAGRHSHRPADSDQLHTDVWWQGENVAIDPGTYSYNAEGKWQGIPLRRSEYHNTVTVDGQEQAKQVSRFMVLPWPVGRLTSAKCSLARALAYCDLEQTNYQRLADPVAHRRTIIRLGDEHWLVVDILEGQAKHDFRLHWLLCDSKHEWQTPGALVLNLAAGDYRVQVTSSDQENTAYELVRADEQSCRGWFAPRYSMASPALSLTANLCGKSAVLATLLGPNTAQLHQQSDALRVVAEKWEARVGLQSVAGGRHALQQVTMTGIIDDEISF